MTDVTDVPAAAPEDVLLGRWELREGPQYGPPMSGYGIELTFSRSGSNDDCGPSDQGGMPASGCVSGRSGVNRLQGKYWSVAEPKGESEATGILAFGPLAVTLMAGPAAAMAAEQAFLQILDRVRGYRVGGSELDLLGDSGVLLAQMQQAKPAPVTV